MEAQLSVLLNQVASENLRSTQLLGQILAGGARLAQLSEQLQALTLNPAEVRKAKIQRYKAKLQRRRRKVAVTRNCPGRGAAARERARQQGKFAKVA
jgi:hypothetical protein